MSARARRAVLAAAGAAFALFAAYAAFRGWASGVSEEDLAGRLPEGCEAVASVARLAEAAPLLRKALGIDTSVLESLDWTRRFGGAAVGVKGREVIAVVECPRAGSFVSLEPRIADALKLKKAEGGAWELAGVKFWIRESGNLVWLSTAGDLLSAPRQGGSAPAPASLELRDAGLLARLDARRETMNDVERFFYTKLRPAVQPGGIVRGRFAGTGVELEGAAEWPLAERESAKRAVAAKPARSLLTGTVIPGLAWMHADTLSAPHVWDEIVRDPENSRFVHAFQKEIEEYEKFLGGRDFESDLLPRLGPGRLWALARADWKAFGVKPKSPLPVVLFAIECRGIEDEVRKSLDRFLTEAEREGKKFDLPAPRGRVQPVLDPFSHSDVTVEGVKVTRLVFREGVSEFGNEVSPGYAILDGTLWISSFWPLLPHLRSAELRRATQSRSGDPPILPTTDAHTAGLLDGPAALAVVRDLVPELAEMTATWDVLDRVQPLARADFDRRYGTPHRWTSAMLTQFTQLETELRRERPDLARVDFDKELESRLKAWEAAETRGFAALRAEPLKRTPEFAADVAARRARYDSWAERFRPLDSASWETRRSLSGSSERLEWTLRLTLK
jgi:hypothetical protein